MKVTVSYQYDSVEEAILALGKQAGVAKVRRAAAQAASPAVAGAATQPLPAAVSAPVAVAPTPATVAAPGAAPAKRKPGRPVKNSEGRKTSATREGGAAQSAEPLPSEPSVPAPVVQEPSASPVDGAGALHVASIEDAQKALERLFETKPPVGGIDGARDALSRFGVQKLRDMKPESRADFIKYIDDTLAGAAKPVA